jgi:hypothetical protein
LFAGRWTLAAGWGAMAKRVKQKAEEEREKKLNLAYKEANSSVYNKQIESNFRVFFLSCNIHKPWPLNSSLNDDSLFSRLALH